MEDIAVLDHIERINRSENIASLKYDFLRFVQEIGFEYFAISQIANPSDIDFSSMQLSHVPTDFRERWLNKNYAVHDPNVIEILTCQRPWSYEDTYARSKGRGRLILDEAKSFNINYGFVVPGPSLSSLPGMVSVSGQYKIDFTDNMLGGYALVCVHAYKKWMYMQKGERSVPHLSDREIEIVSLLAAGYRGQEVEQKLNITRHTLKTYQERIRTKFDAKSTAQAVARAIRGKIIFP